MVCMVHLLSCVGCLNEVEEFISEMSFKHGAMIWKTLLGACRNHENIKLGIHASKHVLKFEPRDATTYVLSSNMYANAGRWDEVIEVRKLMKDIEVKEDSKCS